MKSTPTRRFLAAFLACQPMLWMSDVALAQALDDRAAAAARLSGPSRGETTPRVPEFDGTAPVVPEPGALGPGSSSDVFGPVGTPWTPAAPADSALARERPASPGAPPVDEPVDPDTYVCGPGDVLQLNFWGIQNFKLLAKVDLEGRAFVERVGFFDLRGKTLAEARRLLRASAARYYPRLSFEVTLADPRTFLVQVVDAVAKPASYSARAVDRVAAVIARAGGFARGASKRRIEIHRRGGDVVPADLLRYAITGDVKHNPYVLDGDVVRVPFEDLVASISGAVNRPGRYELTGTRDLAELVELAGGLSTSATRQLPVFVVRRGGEDEKQDLVSLTFGTEGGLPSAALQREDGVQVPSFTELQESVMVIGAVVGAKPEDEASTTRRMPFVHGDSVRSLIERVGGVGPLADLRGAYILRKGNAVPVNLEALLVLRDLQADRSVELGDSVVVPFKRRTILVEGAVFTPGQYPYNPTFGVQQYLALAGGPNRFAKSLSNARVITPTGETKEYSRDLQIEPGSSLVMPERNFSRSEVVQLAISAAGVVLSGVAIFMAAR
jgi:polysaccharide biosynthesis/export protein